MRLPAPLVRAVARGKPHVPPSLWPVLNTLASARGAAPLVADPAPTPTLVVCAHPDDELGCAGTVALLAGRGVAVQFAYATDGGGTKGSPWSAAETGARRAREAAAAGRALGVTSTPEHWGLPDGGLPERVPELVERVTEAVQRMRPARVLVPWFLDGHRDHVAVSRAVAQADLPAELEVWGFEWWTPLVANRLVDVTSVWPRKQAAAACHETAALAFDLTAGLALSRWRSLSGLHGQGYGEAFLALPHPEYRRLAEGDAADD